MWPAQRKQRCIINSPFGPRLNWCAACRWQHAAHVDASSKCRKCTWRTSSGISLLVTNAWIDLARTSSPHQIISSRALLCHISSLWLLRDTPLRRVQNTFIAVQFCIWPLRPSCNVNPLDPPKKNAFTPDGCVGVLLPQIWKWNVAGAKSKTQIDFWPCHKKGTWCMK